MSWDFARTTEQIARKEYNCGASEWIIEMGIEYDLHDCDNGGVYLKDIAKARKEEFKILPGTKYIKTKGKWNGEWTVFRARPEMNSICVDFDLYPDE